MKMNRLFSFDTQVIEDINARIARGNRSNFVNEAVRDKLYGNNHIPIADLSSLRLMRELTLRDDVPDIIKRMLNLELEVPRI